MYIILWMIQRAIRVFILGFLAGLAAAWLLAKVL